LRYLINGGSILFFILEEKNYFKNCKVSKPEVILVEYSSQTQINHSPGHIRNNLGFSLYRFFLPAV
jgi:hypothetical protein